MNLKCEGTKDATVSCLAYPDKQELIFDFSFSMIGPNPYQFS